MIETHQLRECQWYSTNSSTREERGGSKLTDIKHHGRQHEDENRIKFEDCVENEEDPSGIYRRSGLLHKQKLIRVQQGVT